MLDMGRTGPKIAAMEDPLNFGRLPLADGLFEQEEGATWAVVGWDHSHLDAICVGNFEFGLPVQINNHVGIYPQLLPNQVARNPAAIDLAMAPFPTETDVMVAVEMA
jgi:hypothetical protein